MARKYLIMLPIVAILLLISIALGYSYALFSQTKTQTNPNIVTSGCFALDLEEDDYDIALTNTYPMADNEGLTQKAYAFTIKNTCTVDASYVVTFNPLSEGTTISPDIIKINVTGNNDNQASPILDTTILGNLYKDETNKDEFSLNAYIIAQGNLAAASTKTASDGGSQKFQVRFWIDSAASNEVMGQSMAAKIVIRSEATTLAWEKKCAQMTTDLLNCQILENEGGIVAISAKAAPDFTQSPNTDEGVYQTTDLDGISLYYRGAVTDNYVSFLDYYWRIIRINGDGSVRLIYAGKVEDVGEVAYANNYNDSVNKITSLGSTGYNITTNDAKYLGWTYDNQTTVQNSNLKNYLNEWYTGFDNTVDPAQATTKFTYPGDIPGLTSYAINFGNTKFCNDTSSSLATRMSSAQPSLDCPEIVDPDFGGSYTAKVGLISVDEMIMAGVNNSWTTNNSYLNQGYTFWTMSPVTFDSTAQMYTNPGFNNGKQNVDAVVPVRPVISLAKESTVVSGTGTASDPYFIQAIH